MQGSRLVLVLAAGLALAGCLGGTGSQAENASSQADGSAPPSDGASEDPSPQPSDDGTEVPAPDDDPLAAPPDWQVGEWWTVEIVTDEGETRTVTQVVAERHEDAYHVGLAAEDFSDRVVLEHWPPLGEIGTDLTWSVHNTVMEPFRFPLEEGKSWETPWWGDEGHTAEVVETTGTQATLVVDVGEGGDGTYTYDAATETITSFQFGDEVIHRVLDHGTGYEGEVVVPHGRTHHFTVRFAGAFAPGDGPLPCLPAVPCAPVDGPTASIDVEQPHASIELQAGSVPIRNTTTPGFYQETVRDPSGHTFELATTGTDGVNTMTGHSDGAEGTWEFEHVAGGIGFAATEMIAYERSNVTVGANGSGPDS